MKFACPDIQYWPSGKCGNMVRGVVSGGVVGSGFFVVVISGIWASACGAIPLTTSQIASMTTLRRRMKKAKARVRPSHSSPKNRLNIRLQPINGRGDED